MNLTPAVGVQAASSVRVTASFAVKASKETASVPSPVKGTETSHAQRRVTPDFVQSPNPLTTTSLAEVGVNLKGLRLRPVCN